ncbi:hypothetical protein PINS_up001238 [Pythium insidiosum]|nr:hypothetical protein PINS_up001238 [Pythium insidiosum]
MDKYTKLQKIGQGSFGSAFLVAPRARPEQRLVLKEIRLDPRDRASALREARLLAALDHPNIIACRESFLAANDALLCIVTEYADGGDLRRALTQRQPTRAHFNERELVALLVQLCLALKHLHDRKILHRDIKPENIFLTRSQVVKLGDLGVATVLSHTLASAETLTGTPYYTSPEICLGRRYNSKTDVWSLGCVAYELATFAHAFDGRSQRQLFENIVSARAPQVPTAPVGGNGVYSARLAALVGDMLQKNPRDRPSVNQLLRSPLLMERMQGFLSDRALADELSHTVLHGHNVLRDAKPIGAGGRAAAAVVAARSPQQGKKKESNEVARLLLAAKRSSLKATLSRQKSKKRGSPPVAAKANARAAAAASPAVRKKAVAPSASPSPSPLVAKKKAPVPTANQLLLERKQAAVAKARENALQRRHAAAAPQPSRAKPAPSPKTKTPPVRQSPGPLPPPPPSAVAERIAAFNAQVLSSPSVL